MLVPALGRLWAVDLAGKGDGHRPNYTHARNIVYYSYPHVSIPMYPGGPTMSCKVDYASSGANGAEVGAYAKGYAGPVGDGGMRDIGRSMFTFPAAPA